MLHASHLPQLYKIINYVNTKEQKAEFAETERFR